MTKSVEGQKLLIVENDAVFRKRLAEAMRKRGFCTFEAEGLTQATESICQEAFNFAVVDLHLDDGSGLDVVKQIKRKSAQTKAIVLTGYGHTPSVVAAVKLGADDCLVKPASADEITDALMAPNDELPRAPKRPIGPETARNAHIKRFLRKTEGNITQTARLLGMHRRSLQRTLSRLEIKGSAEDDGKHG